MIFLLKWNAILNQKRLLLKTESALSIKSKKTDDETHFILRCPFYSDLRNALFSNLDNIFYKFTPMNQDQQFNCQ